MGALQLGEAVNHGSEEVQLVLGNRALAQILEFQPGHLNHGVRVYRGQVLKGVFLVVRHLLS